MNEAFRAVLLASADLAALVGDRISWGARNRGAALPSVVLHLIDGDPDYTMSGPSGLRRARVQVDCFAETYTAAEMTRRAVVAAVSGLRETRDGIQFQGVFVDGERDLSDDGSESDEILFRLSVDLQVWHGSE